MIAIFQERFSSWRATDVPVSVQSMVKHADVSETAAEVRAQQQLLLMRLRQIYDQVQADAARRAGVSMHAWSRMETGKATVDPVAVARWCKAHGIPSEYVFTGGLDGYPAATQRLLILAEEEAALKAAGRQGTLAPASQPPKRSRGRPRRNTGTAAV